MVGFYKLGRAVDSPFKCWIRIELWPFVVARACLYFSILFPETETHCVVLLGCQVFSLSQAGHRDPPPPLQPTHLSRATHHTQLLSVLKI